MMNVADVIDLVEQFCLDVVSQNDLSRGGVEGEPTEYSRGLLAGLLQGELNQNTCFVALKERLMDEDRSSRT